jgi:hypothetical protein
MMPRKMRGRGFRPWADPEKLIHLRGKNFMLIQKPLLRADSLGRGVEE